MGKKGSFLYIYLFYFICLEYLIFFIYIYFILFYLLHHIDIFYIKVNKSNNKVSEASHLVKYWSEELEILKRRNEIAAECLKDLEEMVINHSIIPPFHPSIILPSSFHHPPIILPSSFHHPPIILPSSFHHPPIILPSSFHHPSIILPSSFHHPSIILPSFILLCY
jgi:hypothetical protein